MHYPIKKLLYWPILILILHAFLTVTGGYYWWAHMDKIMHVLGGMSIALSAVAALKMFNKTGELKISNKFITAVIILSLVALAAVSWEFLEFTLDHVAHTHMQPSLTDTMGDILAGLCGAGVIILFKNTQKQLK